MKRSVSKFLARLLCILLALTLPLSSLAQSSGTSWLEEAWAAGKPVEATLTFIPGEALKAIPAAADMLEALSLRLVAQGDGFFSLDLLVSGQEAMSFAFRAEEEGYYVQSQALSNQALYFSREDAQTQLLPGEGATLPSAQEEPGAPPPPAQDQVPAPLLELYEALGIDTTGPEAADPNEWKDVYRSLGFGEDLIQWMAEFYNKAVVTPGEFTDPGHDPAIVKYETFMNEQDIVAFYQIPAVYSLVSQLVSQYITLTDPFLTSQEVSEATRQVMDEVLVETENSPFTLTTSSLYAQDGLVFQDSAYSFSPSDGSQGVLLDMPSTYRRLTAGDARTHSLQGKLSINHVDRLGLDAMLREQGEDYTYKVVLDDFTHTLVLLEGDIQEAEGAFSLFATVNGQDVFGLEAASTYGEAEEAQEIKLLIRQDALASLLNESVPISSRQGLEHLLTFRVRSSVHQEQEDRFAAIREARPDTSIQPLTMTEKEQADFFEKTFQTYFLRSVFKLMSLLPSSVMELLAQDIIW